MIVDSLEKYTFSFFLFGTRRPKIAYCLNQIMKCFVNIYSGFCTSFYIANLGERESYCKKIKLIFFVYKILCKQCLETDHE